MEICVIFNPFHGVHPSNKLRVLITKIRIFSIFFSINHTQLCSSHLPYNIYLLPFSRCLRPFLSLFKITGDMASSATSVADTEAGCPSHEGRRKQSMGKRGMALLLGNYFCVFVGSVASSLLTKFYFVHKGGSRWVSTWVQSAGFPILILPIYAPYITNQSNRKPFSGLTPKLIILSVAVGLMLGVNNLLFSWGSSYLPVSTSSLLLSSQLAFTLILSVIIVRTKVTFSNLNCVVLLTLSSLLLALGSRHDRPHGLSRHEYFVGFFCTLGAGLLFSLYLPVMEKVYRDVKCYGMVMEMQLVMEVAATVLAMVGMGVDGGFREMRRESSVEFDLGETVYWVVIAVTLITWQLCFMGTAGMVFLTTSITSGICTTALMAFNVLGGVIVFGDSFMGVKAVATVLCIWGFCSYLYGMKVKERRRERERERGRGEEIQMANNNNNTTSF